MWLGVVIYFASVAGILLWFVVWQTWQQKTLATPWFYSFLITTALAAPQVAWQMIGNFSESFSYWKLGWLTPVGESIFLFWIRNLGLGGVLIFTNLWFINRLRQRKDFHALYYIPLVILFVITNVYIFQPHEYDNIKFIVFSYLGFSLYCGAFLATWLRRTWAYRITAALLFISLTLVGILSLLRESYTQWEFNTAEDISTAAIVRTIIPPDARVLTSDQHNHFITTLVGRPIVMGYRGWLWTYGINYRSVEKDVASMFSGAANAPELFQKYDISFVVIGPSERLAFEVHEEYFAQHSSPIFQTPTYTIYDVRSLVLQ